MIKKKRTPKPVMIIVGFVLLILVLAVPFMMYLKNEEKPEKKDIKSQTATFKRVKKPQLCITKNLETEIYDQFDKEKIEYKLISLPSEETYNLSKNEDGKIACDVILQKDTVNTNKLVNIYNRIFVAIVNDNSTYPSYISINEDELTNLLRSKKYKGYKVLWSKNANKFLQKKVNSPIYSDLDTNEVLNAININKTDHQQIAIIPFKTLLSNSEQNRFRILTIENNSPLKKNFSILTYPFVESFWVEFPTPMNNTQQREIENKLTEILENIFGDEYDSSKLTVLSNTGYSTVGAGMQHELIEQKNDYTYPLRGIYQTLKYNDIIVINNESPITEKCKISSQSSKDLCGYPSSLKMFTEMFKDNEKVIIDGAGFDIYDFGKFGVLQTMIYYKESNIQYFGLGKNSDEAHKPLIVSTDNLTFAFLTYNVSPVYIGYNATSTRPGNTSSAHITEDIKKAKEKSDFIIVNIHNPITNTHKIQSYNVRPSRSFIDVGADIVLVNNQPTVKGSEKYKDTLLFYGLGTFLTDRVRKNRSGVIVQLYFYGDKLISHDIIPTILNENGQIKVATSKEGEEILQIVQKNDL